MSCQGLSKQIVQFKMKLQKKRKKDHLVIESAIHANGGSDSPFILSSAVLIAFGADSLTILVQIFIEVSPPRESPILLQELVEGRRTRRFVSAGSVRAPPPFPALDLAVGDRPERRRWRRTRPHRRRPRSSERSEHLFHSRFEALVHGGFFILLVCWLLTSFCDCETPPLWGLFFNSLSLWGWLW